MLNYMPIMFYKKVTLLKQRIP